MSSENGKDIVESPIYLPRTNDQGVQTERDESHSPDICRFSDTNDSPTARERIRRRPKVYTPNCHDSDVYCFCQQENTGWYLECDVRHPGCLVYYHAKCVGLDNLKSAEDGDAFNNYRDGGFRCPKCFAVDEKNKPEPLENVENALDEIYFSNLSEQEGNLVITDDFQPNCQETPIDYLTCGGLSDISSDFSDELQNPTSQYNVRTEVNDNENNNGIQQGLTPQPPTLSDNKDLDGSDSHITDNKLTSTDCKQYCLSDSSVEGDDRHDFNITPEATKHESFFNRSDEEHAVEFDDVEDDLTSADFETIDNLTKAYIGESADTQPTLRNAPSVDLPVSHETLSRMMDCPRLQKKSFLLEDIPRRAYFSFSEDEWDKIKPSPLHHNK